MSPESRSKLEVAPSSDWRISNFNLLRLLAALQVAAIHGTAYLMLSGYFTCLLVAALDLFPRRPDILCDQ